MYHYSMQLHSYPAWSILDNVSGWDFQLQASNFSNNILED